MLRHSDAQRARTATRCCGENGARARFSIAAGREDLAPIVLIRFESSPET